MTQDREKWRAPTIMLNGSFDCMKWDNLLSNYFNLFQLHIEIKHVQNNDHQLRGAVEIILQKVH